MMWRATRKFLKIESLYDIGIKCGFKESAEQKCSRVNKWRSKEIEKSRRSVFVENVTQDWHRVWSLKYSADSHDATEHKKIAAEPPTFAEIKCDFDKFLKGEYSKWKKQEKEMIEEASKQMCSRMMAEERVQSVTMENGSHDNNCSTPDVPGSLISSNSESAEQICSRANKSERKKIEKCAKIIFTENVWQDWYQAWSLKYGSGSSDITELIKMAEPPNFSTFIKGEYFKLCQQKRERIAEATLQKWTELVENRRVEALKNGGKAMAELPNFEKFVNEEFLKRRKQERERTAVATIVEMGRVGGERKSGGEAMKNVGTPV